MKADSKPLDLSGCGQCACFNLRKAARAVTQLFDATLQPLGLRATQFTIITLVAHRGPINISNLADRLVMDRTTLSRDLGPLEKRDWVKIQPGKDRRTRAVELTAEGRRVLGDALPRWRRTQQKVIDGLGRRGFEGLLDELSSTVSVVKGAG